MRAVPEIDQGLEARVEDLGYELVDVQWGGSGRRPLLRLRIDRPDTVRGEGVTVDECAKVSRSLETWLDEHEALAERGDLTEKAQVRWAFALAYATIICLSVLGNTCIVLAILRNK